MNLVESSGLVPFSIHKHMNSIQFGAVRGGDGGEEPWKRGFTCKILPKKASQAYKGLYCAYYGDTPMTEMARINLELIRSLWKKGWQTGDIAKHLVDMRVTASIRAVQRHCRQTRHAKRNRKP
eukprot:superscaffoldBa00011129_g25065